MTHYRHDPAFLKIVDAMIETVEFDVNGRAGQGGNGGLTSDKAIRLSAEARIMRDRIRKTEAGLFPIEIAPELMAQPIFHVAYDDDKGHHHTWNVESEDFEAANSHCQLFQTKYVGKSFPNGQGHYPYQNVRVLVSDKIVTGNVAAFSMPLILPHPDDLSINNFAAAMSAKMEISRDQKGRGGWEDKKQCTQQELSAMLIACVRKGDPVDVANLAMMLHQRGESIKLDDVTEFEAADWYWRTMDPDDSGDYPQDAINRAGLGPYCIAEIASSFTGPRRFGFIAPVLELDSDEEEFLHFATEAEALDAAKLRRLTIELREAERECCIACDVPLEVGDLVYWSSDDTGHLHAECCGPERESYVNADGAPLKHDEPIPAPFNWKPDHVR